MTGSSFAQAIAPLDVADRETAILDEVLAGNIPDFLRRLVPVELVSRRLPTHVSTATIFVMSDYLAIGSDEDFLRIPMNLETALAIAARFRFVLPTTKMVDAIYQQAAHRFIPEPMTPGPQMRSTDYYRRHNALIEEQIRASHVPVGDLVAGHKKDVVVTNRLASKPDRVAIYGWQRRNGQPIQPLSTFHGICYADYSHGIRLVSALALLDGEFRPVEDILQNAVLASVLSDEGPILRLWELPAHRPEETYCDEHWFGAASGASAAENQP